MNRCRHDFWYYAVVAALAVLAIVPRFVVLEERPLHHDEAQHAWYGYSSMRDGHYTHSPILHGPSLILTTGLVYKALGDSIGVGRGMVAAFSLIAMLAAAALWPRRYRWWFFPLIVTSPYLLYYSRFLRNELIFCAFVLVGVIGFARSMRGRSLAKRAAWGMLGPAPIVALLAWKENAIFVMASGVVFGAVWLVAHLFWARATRTRRLRRVRAWHAPFVTPEAMATFAGWLAGVAVGMAYVIFIYGITAQKGTFAPLVNIHQSIQYWAGQQSEHRISGTLYYHLPIMLTYELPILLMLAVGLILDAVRAPRRSTVYLLAIAGWLVLWSIWHGMSPLPWPLGGFEKFLHIQEPGVPMLVLGLWIVPLLVWSILALKEHMLLGSWMAFWAACSIFQYSVAGEKVPWLGVHIVLPVYMALGWVWAPILRRSGGGLRAAAIVAMVCATALAVRNDYYLIGPRAADPVERMVYNHTTVEYDHMCREWLSRWQRQEAERRLSDRRVDLVGDLGWPGVWYFRHCAYDLPENPPESTDGWDLIMGVTGVMNPLCQRINSPLWKCTAMSLRDHWTPAWPEGNRLDQWRAWWRYYWRRETWSPTGHFEMIVVEPLGGSMAPSAEPPKR